APAVRTASPYDAEATVRDVDAWAPTRPFAYARRPARRLRRSSSRLEYAAARIASSDSRPVPRPPPTVAADATNQARTNRSPELGASWTEPASTTGSITKYAHAKFTT